LAGSRREGKRTDSVAASAVAGIGLEVESLVDDPIAVVVEAITDLDAAVRRFAFAPVRRVLVGVDEVPGTHDLAGPVLAGRDRIRRRAVLQAPAAVEWIRKAVGRGVITELNGASSPSATAAPRSARAARPGDAGSNFRKRPSVEVKNGTRSATDTGVDGYEDATEVIETFVAACRRRDEEEPTCT
jgi:hypothetical protein